MEALTLSKISYLYVENVTRAWVQLIYKIIVKVMVYNFQCTLVKFKPKPKMNIVLSMEKKEIIID